MEDTEKMNIKEVETNDEGKEHNENSKVNEWDEGE